MGWNTWNHFACNINATVIMEAADAMVSTGLKDLGYEYVNIDDCWALKERSADGKIVPDPERFPDGIIGVANYVHKLGLKLGIYSDAGSATCQGQPGSLYHEEVDAASFAEWEVDYLKYDTCHTEGVKSLDRYPPMRDALNATGRPIFYSICNWGREKAPTWAFDVGNSWRTTIDIKDFWLSMKYNFKVNAWYPEFAGPGAWNDPDMLEVGNGGMSTVEYTSHYSLWAIAKAPLIIGCDMTNMDKDTLAILSNKEVIAVNQDPLGIQGTCRTGCGWLNSIFQLEPEVWAAPLVDGSLAVVVINWSYFTKSSTTVQMSDLDLTGNYTVHDLWQNNEVATSGNSIKLNDIPGRGCRFLKLVKDS